eukprot:gene17776-21205_t
MAKLIKPKKGFKKPKVILTQTQKDQKLQEKEIRSLMLNMGFKRAPRIDGTQFIYEGRTSEMDDIFYFENIVLLTEYTVKKSVSSHLINKKVIYDKIKDDAGEFIKFLLGCTQFQAFSDAFSEHVLSKYSIKQLQIRVLYASKFQIPSEHKLLVNNIKYFDYPIVKYFEGIAKVIRKTAKHEFFDFLEIDFDKVADNIKGTSVSSAHDFHGHILPEEHSSFKEGYKLISFYIDADSLLKRSFVLRKEGWRNTDNVGLYQRMFVATKMRSLRKYLHEEQRNESSIIGIIDGQHRAYAYHEGEDIYEESIAKLRGIQNLLVTGILYPKNENEDKRLKFEAKLFLEINANQSGASSGLKQEIEYYLIPFSTTSIAKYIKTASIISFGLKPLIKFDGNDSLFKIWNNANKEKLRKKTEDFSVLQDYKHFVVEEIRNILIGFKDNIANEKWVMDRSDLAAILNVTTINGIINCLRILIENNKNGDVHYYRTKLKEVDSFDFNKYKSSQYRQMGQDLYNNYFI